MLPVNGYWIANKNRYVQKLKKKQFFDYISKTIALRCIECIKC